MCLNAVGELRDCVRLPSEPGCVLVCVCVCGTALASNLLSAASMSFATLNALKAEVAVMRAFKKTKKKKTT